MKQAAGKQVISPPSVPNFEEDEPAFRFGHGARQHYGKDHLQRDDRLERTLQKDWSPSGDEANRDRYSNGIRRGYEYPPKP